MSAFDKFVSQAIDLVGPDVHTEWLQDVWEEQQGDFNRALAFVTESKIRRRLRSSGASSSSSSRISTPSPDDFSTPVGMVGSQWGHAPQGSDIPLPSPGLDAAAPTSDTVQVVARFRPFSERELETASDIECVEFGDDGRTCTLATEHPQAEVEFHFNRVFEPLAGQEEVYDLVGRPIVGSVINGFNGAIIAYGQTGSGKTHTMMGPAGARALIAGDFDDPELGLVPRALLELQNHAQRSDGLVTLRVSYVEVYQEKIIDLLSVTKKQKAALTSGQNIRQDNEGLWLPQVAEMPVESAREALEIMQAGNKQRTTADTKMNHDSSRSHAIFIVTVTNSTDPVNRKFAQLYLADLAGSERVGKTAVWGQQLDEAKLINRSLLALGQVIFALSTNAKHIPYRDSKLTRLLQNCLGGNAKTSLICTASPHPANANESLSTLRFGDRASKIRNEAKMNIALDANELKRQLIKARAELAELRGAYLQLERDCSLCSRGSASTPSLPTVPSSYVPPVSQQLSICPAPTPAPIKIETPIGETSQQTHELIARRLFTRELLPALICPLTRAVMHDPVCAADGSSYDRAAVEKLLKQAGRMPAMSPVTGRPFPSKLLVPNIVLKTLITSQMPNLPPPQKVHSGFSRMSIYLVEEIFTFLPGRALGSAQCACADFLAIGSKHRLWVALAAVEFGMAESGDVHAQYVKKADARAASSRSQKAARKGAPSTGLHLMPIKTN